MGSEGVMHHANKLSSYQAIKLFGKLKRWGVGLLIGSSAREFTKVPSSQPFSMFM